MFVLCIFYSLWEFDPGKDRGNFVLKCQPKDSEVKQEPFLKKF